MAEMARTPEEGPALTAEQRLAPEGLDAYGRNIERARRNKQWWGVRVYPDDPDELLADAERGARTPAPGQSPDLAEGRRLLAAARAAADGPAWAIPLRRDAAEHWLYLHADELLADAEALAGARATVARLRALLATIQQWDCLNPPNTGLCEDLPWLRELVDTALAPEREGASE